MGIKMLNTILKKMKTREWKKWRLTISFSVQKLIILFGWQILTYSFIICIVSNCCESQDVYHQMFVIIIVSIHLTSPLHGTDSVAPIWLLFIFEGFSGSIFAFMSIVLKKNVIFRVVFPPSLYPSLYDWIFFFTLR